MNTHLNARTLSSYLDDMLSKSERAQAELHLKSCAECRAMLDDFQGLGQMFRDLPTFEPPEAEVSAVQEPVVRPQKARRPFRKYSTLAAAAVVILALGLGGLSYVAAPTVVYASQPDGAQHMMTASPVITIKFSKRMDQQSVLDALTIEPQTKYVPVWQEDSQILQLQFPDGYQPHASYTITIADSAEDRFGLDLKEPFVVHFDTWEDRSTQQPEQGKEFKLVDEQTIPWSDEKARQVQEQVNNGSLVGRLSPDQAAMDDLFTAGLLNPAEYEPPLLTETGSATALIRFNKTGGGYALATVEQLVQKDQHGAWFTTKVEWYE